MTSFPLHYHVLLSNLYELMASAVVGIVLVFAVAVRSVARIAKRSTGRAHTHYQRAPDHVVRKETL